jgi:hypothetical protein
LPDFNGLELSAQKNLAVMNWSVPVVSNPWGCLENNFPGMSLRFVDLQFLHVGPRREGMPLTEDRCISNILRVDPNVQNDDPYLRQSRDSSDSFRLAFRFQSGRVIEIESQRVELIPIEK